MPSNVSIIIVNYNGLELLQDCFKSLEKVKNVKFDIILVDNASSDGSIILVKKYRSVFNIKIVRNKANLGFAEANNIGLKYVKGKYILLLNNDTIVTKDFLLPLVETMEKSKDVGVVQPKIIFYASKKLQSAGSFITNTGFLYHVGYDKNPNNDLYNKSTPIFSANGACMLVRKELVEKVGLFDPDYFAYFEEGDFCWRTWLAGYRVIYNPKSVIYHKGAKTSKKLDFGFINYHSYKNRICSILKNFSLPQVIKVLPVNLVFTEVSALAFLFKGKFRVSMAIQSSILWNITNFRKTLKKRKQVQNTRKVKDLDILKIVSKRVRIAYYYYLFFGLENYKDD